MIYNRSVRRFAICTLSATFLSSQVVHADAYEAGTTTFKPMIMDVASFTFGRRRGDSQMRSYGEDLFTAQFIPVQVNQDAYRAPLSFGFHQADRNGYGYGAEFGYVIGWDNEIFVRAGFSHEHPQGRFLVGDRSFNFKPRSNWGMLFGARHYIDCQSAWKPFLSAAGGFTVQDKVKATINRHNPFAYYVADTDIPIGKYKFLNRKALLNLELGAGVDYTFSEHWAVTFDAALRYGGRGGSGSVMTPAAPPPPGGGLPSRAAPVFYKDHRPKWTIPVRISLKATGVVEALTQLAQGIPGISSTKKEPGFIDKSKKGQQFVGKITNDTKYTHYRESGQRYKIDVWQNLLVVPVNDFEFIVDLQRDTQSGASTAAVNPTALITPAPNPNGLVTGRTGSTVNDDRSEISFTTAYNLKDSKYSTNLYYSTEDDYLSKGIGLGGTWFFNKNNTTLDTKASVSQQTVKPTKSGAMPLIDTPLTVGRESGHNIKQKYYISLRQDLTKYSYVLLSGEYEYQHGMLNDPYKAVIFYGDARAFTKPGLTSYYQSFFFPPGFFPAGVTATRENLPRSRSIWTPMINFVQYVPWTDGAAHFNYRFSADTWGLRSHTFELTYYQPFHDRWEVVPYIRYYSQNAVKFYGPIYNYVNQPSPFPSVPVTSRHYTSDYRLARFGSLSYEIKLTYKLFDQMKLGFIAGYYARKPGYSMAKKDRISNPEYRNSPIGAKYFGLDLNFKF